MPPKFLETLESFVCSPKFWAAAVPLATALALYQMGELNSDALADAMVIAAAISTGAMALEEGVSQLFGILAKREQPK